MESSYVNDDQDQKQGATLNKSPERDCSNDRGQVYMVLNAAQVKSSEYEDFQTGNITTKEIDKQVKDTKKTRVWITISILLTGLAVLTFIALAIGALGLRQSSNTQPIIAERPQNYTYLIEEISALKSLLVETQRNISQLDDRLSSSGHSLLMSVSRLSNSADKTQRNISQLDDRLSSSGHSLSMSASRLSNSADSAFSSIGHLSLTSISHLSAVAHQLSTSVSFVSTSVNQIHSSASSNFISIRLLNTSISELNSTVPQLSSSIHSLSTSVNQLFTSIRNRCTCSPVPVD